ncbi:hypothetical protein NMY22_g11818 [Coprinellus aureogranulatus]|nr:hypothetical protein NMY22_g11818 [Coprinellus aureogranulatus]
MKIPEREPWEWEYGNYCGSDAGPEWDSEEEAAMLKEIENDPTIDWHQEYLDAIDYKPGDKIEEIDGYELEIEIEDEGSDEYEEEEEEGAEYSGPYEDEPEETGSNLSTSDGEYHYIPHPGRVDDTAVQDFRRRWLEDSRDAERGSAELGRSILESEDEESEATSTAESDRKGKEVNARKRARDGENDHGEEEKQTVKQQDAKGKEKARAELPPPAKKAKGSAESNGSKPRRTFRDVFGTSKVDV